MAVESTIEVLFERLVEALQSLVVFAAVAGGVYAIGRFVVVPGVRRLVDAGEFDETLRITVLRLTGAIFFLLGLYLAIPLSGLATTPTTIAAISAGATIAIGFASREVLSNLVSGAIIVVDPKFRVGDWIEWKDKEGIVEDITFRATRVHTFDNELITVPNSELTANAVTNPSAKDRRRVTFEFGIGYGDDVEHARAVMVEEALAHDEIIDRPAPRVLLVELADSYVGLRAQFWIAEPERAEFLRIRSAYVQAVKERFDAEGIEMPYPYRQLTGTVGTWDAPEPDSPPPGIE